MFSDATDKKVKKKLISEFIQHFSETVGYKYEEMLRNLSEDNLVQLIEIVTNRIRNWDDLKSFYFFFENPDVK